MTAAPLQLSTPGVAPIVEQLKRRRFKTYQRPRGILIRDFTSERLCKDMADLIAFARKLGIPTPNDGGAAK